jgi:hypothetical protein
MRGRASWAAVTVDRLPPGPSDFALGHSEQDAETVMTANSDMATGERVSTDCDSPGT